MELVNTYFQVVFDQIPPNILLGSTFTLTWSLTGDMLPPNTTFNLVAVQLRNTSSTSLDGVELGPSVDPLDSALNWTNVSPLGQYLIQASTSNHDISLWGNSNNFSVVSVIDASVPNAASSFQQSAQASTHVQTANSIKSSVGLPTPSSVTDNSTSIAATKSRGTDGSVIGSVVGGIVGLSLLLLLLYFVYRRRSSSNITLSPQMDESAHIEPFFINLVVDAARTNQEDAGDVLQPPMLGSPLGIDAHTIHKGPENHQSAEGVNQTLVRQSRRREMGANIQNIENRMNEMHQAIARIEVQLQRSSQADAVRNTDRDSEDRSQNAHELRHRMSNLQAEVERLQDLIREQNTEFPPDYMSYDEAVLVLQLPES